jgi:hypothetical protein
MLGVAMTLILQLVLLFIGGGGAIVSALTLSDSRLRRILICVFGAMTAVGLVLTFVTYESFPSAKEIAQEIAKLNSPLPPKHEPETTVKVDAKPSQTTVDVTPEYLMDIYDGLTAIQAEKLAAAYIGKWVPISGVIQNVGGPSLFGAALISIALHEKGKAKLIVLYFDEGEVTHVESLLQGQSIEAFCQVNRFGANDLRLVHCERR